MNPISLYVHIPFCVKKCLYCDFLSFPIGGRTVYNMEKYIDALINELRLWEYAFQESMAGEPLRFKSVFIGGGTPTCLPAELLFKLGAEIKKFISADTEFNIEANPGTITDEHIEVFKKILINRVSLGLQSANDNELKCLGRIHSFNEFLNSFNKLRQSGFENINIDLMSDIPKQTVKSYENTLKEVLNLSPEHISAYSLIIEPGTPFEKLWDSGKLDIADEETDRKMYKLTKEMLKEYGYYRYEISNYCKPRRECIHNISYWTGGNYLGIGLGAASYVEGIRFCTTRDYNRYINENEQSLFLRQICDVNSTKVCAANSTYWKKIAERREEYTELTLQNRMEEFMFLGLRLCKGVSQKEFYNRFGKTLLEIYGSTIENFLQNNLLIEDANSDRIYLSDRGIDISNYILSDFIL